MQLTAKAGNKLASTGCTPLSPLTLRAAASAAAAHNVFIIAAARASVQMIFTLFENIYEILMAKKRLNNMASAQVEVQRFKNSWKIHSSLPACSKFTLTKENCLLRWEIVENSISFMANSTSAVLLQFYVLQICNFERNIQRFCGFMLHFHEGKLLKLQETPMLR